MNSHLKLVTPDAEKRTIVTPRRRPNKKLRTRHRANRSQWVDDSLFCGVMTAHFFVDNYCRFERRPAYAPAPPWPMRKPAGRGARLQSRPSFLDGSAHVPRTSC
jgi:hypothetical protein